MDGKLPSSCRFKFQLIGSDLVSTTTEFQEMAKEAEETLSTAQQALKKIIIRSQELELSYTRREILHSLIDIIVQYIKAKAVWDGLPSHDNSTLTSKIAVRCLSTVGLCTHLEITKTMALNAISERVFFIEEKDVEIPEAHVPFAQDICKVSDAIIVGSILEFFNQQKINSRLERMEALIQEALIEKATTDTAMAMESENPTDSKTIQRLINNAISKKTKSLQDQIKVLKNKSRGAPVSAPSTKPNDAKADASDNASSDVPSTPPLPPTQPSTRKSKRQSKKKVAFSNAATK